MRLLFKYFHLSVKDFVKDFEIELFKKWLLLNVSFVLMSIENFIFFYSFKLLYNFRISRYEVGGTNILSRVVVTLFFWGPFSKKITCFIIHIYDEQYCPRGRQNIYIFSTEMERRR